MNLSGFIFCSFVGWLLSGWVDLQVVWVVSSCLFSILFLNMEIISEWAFIDSVSSPILTMSILVTALTMLGSLAVGTDFGKIFLLSSSLSIVEIFFLSKSLILMFISFELSLVPMLALILLWSGSPERIQASKFMVLYTMVASAPLLYEILYLDNLGLKIGTKFPSIPHGEIYGIAFCVMAFLVKIPLYMTHSWLPRAHVEASLEGSMVLAGIMLKVGVCGFVRMLSLLTQSGMGESVSLILTAIYPVALLGSSYAMLSALSSDDLKLSVAFSSISHMNLCVAGLCAQTELSLEGGVISMVSHGMISPLLFFNVTIMYLFSHSRSVLVNKGLHGKIPQLKLASLAIWTINLGVPPFLSFLGEMKLLGSIFSHHSTSVVFILSFMMLGSLYMVTNYGILNHSGMKASIKGVPSLVEFLLSSFVVILLSVVIFFSTI